MSSHTLCMPAFCPLCAQDDHTETHELEDGTSYAICLDSSHGSDGYVWEPWVEKDRRSGRGDGLGAELEIWDKLLACFTPTDSFISFGEVEDRFISRYPSEATLLLHRYGHRWRDPEHRASRYSMSTYLALRLRELEKEGMLELEWGPATGPWAYNETISHWRTATGAPTATSMPD